MDEQMLYALIGRLYVQINLLTEKYNKVQLTLQQTQEQLGLIKDGNEQKRISDK